eukprot:TRINITY_DN16202_c1_g1_i4.p1 TRINITY_DN16202_c1_g1~~TRINITY_DN16202_c1_g1_i4.p1  ORF type:complete len:100 (-),score=0.07 TRINITY_DN16202_c1_g1_i4:50-349(-)
MLMALGYGSLSRRKDPHKLCLWKRNQNMCISINVATGVACMCVNKHANSHKHTNQHTMCTHCKYATGTPLAYGLLQMYVFLYIQVSVLTGTNMTNAYVP